MDDTDKLAAGMDLHQPRWATEFAEQRDLLDYIISTNERGAEHAMSMLRTRVARRLMMPVRAAIEAGLVKLAD